MSILALHGFSGLGSDFAPFAKLSELDSWHCPNRPGHGAEPKLDCSPEATGELIDRERGNRSILLGYSMGARAALLHAHRYPKAWDLLILISPNPGIEEESERAERRAVDEKLAAKIEAEGVAAFIEFWQGTAMIRSQQNICQDWRITMDAARHEHSAEGLAASLRQFGQGHFPNLWHDLDKLTMPVLLITGAEDVKYTRIAKRMLDRLPKALGETLRDCGHMPHPEMPETCAGVFRDFLKAHGLPKR